MPVKDQVLLHNLLEVFLINRDNYKEQINARKIHLQLKLIHNYLLNCLKYQNKITLTITFSIELKPNLLPNPLLNPLRKKLRLTED